MRAALASIGKAHICDIIGKNKQLITDEKSKKIAEKIGVGVSNDAINVGGFTKAKSKAGEILNDKRKNVLGELPGQNEESENSNRRQSVDPSSPFEENSIELTVARSNSLPKTLPLKIQSEITKFYGDFSNMLDTLLPEEQFVQPIDSGLPSRMKIAFAIRFLPFNFCRKVFSH